MIIFAADDPLVLNGTYDCEGFKPGERARIAKARAQHAKGSPRMAKRTKKAKQKSPDAPEPKHRGRPRQADLPGTEDRKIRALEDAAASYAEIRDERMALNLREAELKTALLSQMKKLGKTVYHRDGITITVIPEAENVKVRVKKAGDEEISDEFAPDDGEEFAEERAAAVDAGD